MATEKKKDTKKTKNKKENMIITAAEKEQIKETITKEITTDIEQKVEKKVIADVVNKIKEETADEIKDEFVESVKSEVKSQIIKEEKRLLRHRKWKIIRRDLFILVLLVVIGYLCYLLYKGIDVDIITKKNTSQSEVSTKAKEVVKDTEWYIKNYGYLLEETHLKLPGENINKYYLYNVSQTANDINDSVRLIMAYNLLQDGEIKTEGNKYVVESSALKKAYQKLFDNNYVETSFNIDCMTYNFNKNRYEAIINECSNLNNYEVAEEITNMYEQDKNIIIETIMGVVSDNKLYNYNNLYVPITDSLNGKSIIDYRGNLNSYKYTFAKINDVYKFISIEKE